MALTNKLTAIADAIREKTSKTELLTLDQMAEEIAGIQAGGGTSVAEKDVNFYDYDGTVLYAYTVEEAQALNEMPALPEREGLICQGWNWSLEDIKAHNRAVNVGAMYITDDGKTRVYITLTEGRTSPMLGVGINGTVTVDWGDGTEPDVVEGYSIQKLFFTPTHEYANSGDYVISLTVDGEMGFYGSSSGAEGVGILRYSSNGDDRNYAYRAAVQKIETGEGVTSIGRYAFYCCHGLTSITIPNSVTSINADAFSNCHGLTSITIPNGVTSINDYTFYGCYALTSVSIPNSVTSIGSYGRAFYSCYNLTNVSIPNSVTSIGSNAFYDCYALTSIFIPNGVTSIKDSTFDCCRSLTSVSIPNSVTSIGSSAFSGCGGLGQCDFTNHTAVPTLSSSMSFYSIPTDCKIYVPAALYDEWIAATNWSSLASQIVAV